MIRAFLSLFHPNPLVATAKALADLLAIFLIFVLTLGLLRLGVML